MVAVSGVINLESSGVEASDWRHAMISDTTKPDSWQPAAEMTVGLFDNWSLWASIGRQSKQQLIRLPHDAALGVTLPKIRDVNFALSRPRPPRAAGCSTWAAPQKRTPGRLSARAFLCTRSTLSSPALVPSWRTDSLMVGEWMLRALRTSASAEADLISAFAQRVGQSRPHTWNGPS